jgi:hypothetical protein
MGSNTGTTPCERGILVLADGLPMAIDIDDDHAEPPQAPTSLG